MRACKYWLQANLDKNIEYLKKKIEFERSFWGAVDNLRLKRRAELEVKITDIELYYEELVKQEKILRELRKQGLWV